MKKTILTIIALLSIVGSQAKGKCCCLGETDY